MSRSRHHLFLALTRAGWGETALGLRVAQQLQQAGDEPVFLVHETAAPLFVGGSIRYETYPMSIGPLLEFLIEDHVSTLRPDSIILSDFQMTVDNMRLLSLDARMLTRFGIPLVAMDTWCFAESGPAIDIFVGKTKPNSSWIEELPYRLAPVPFIRPKGVAGACSLLPEPIKLTRRVREHIRDGLGLSGTNKAVLLCTANWQQAAYNDDNGQRIADAVPQLIGQYLQSLGSSVHLIHVGPSALPVRNVLGDRYHWMPSLSAERFSLILGAVDLLLSLNVSASTMATAIVSGLPLLVVQNSCAALDRDSVLGWLPRPPSPRLLEWIANVVPLYPFSMWPLGFYHYLAPVLRNNDYCTAFETVELLDEDALLAACDRLLFDRDGAAAALSQRQADYVRTVAALPSAAQCVHSYLEGLPCDPP